MLFPSPRGAAVLLSTSVHFSRIPPSPPPHFLFLFSAAAATFSLFSLLHTTLSPPSRAAALRMKPTAAAGASSPSLSFSSPESLASWLSARLPPGVLSVWGSAPGSKPLRNLWLEISLGESSLLLDSLPVRTVHVATIRIFNSRGARLIEARQLLSNGSIRSRNRHLSEKMKPGESIEAAVARAVAEELGGEAAVEIIPGTYDVKIEDWASSESYPGLPARYVLHTVDARVVRGVPEEGEFETEESGEKAEAGDEDVVLVKRHYWRWVEDDDGAAGA